MAKCGVCHGAGQIMSNREWSAGLPAWEICPGCSGTGILPGSEFQNDGNAAPGPGSPARSRRGSRGDSFSGFVGLVVMAVSGYLFYTERAFTADWAYFATPLALGLVATFVVERVAILKKLLKLSLLIAIGLFIVWLVAQQQ